MDIIPAMNQENRPSKEEINNMKVLESLMRFYIHDMDTAIGFYERIFDEKCTTRFTYTRFNLELARVGAVLIIA